MNMTMHPITNDDQPFLEEICYHAIFVPEGSPPPPREVVQDPDLRKYYADFGRFGDIGVVAVREIDQPVAAAWLRLLTGKQAGYGYVDDATPELTIATLPEYRGKGIGTRLLEALFAEANKQFSAISLSVWPANPAYQLYQRLGFVVVKENENDVVMVKRLES